MDGLVLSVLFAVSVDQLRRFHHHLHLHQLHPRCHRSNNYKYFVVVVDVVLQQNLD